MKNIPLVKLDGQYILGEAVKQFEDDYAKFCNAKHCVGCNSGTSAIHLALLALGIKPGDEVITTPNTFIATTFPIIYTGATIKFVDVKLDTALIDINQLEEAITEKTKAIIIVDLYGQMPNMQWIQEVAMKHNIHVIEDACQAHGAEWRGHPPGYYSDIACYSFYPSKNLGCHGDGGAITTNNDAYAQMIRILANQGRSTKYTHTDVGYNYRLATMQAEVLNKKLPHLPQWIEQRRNHASFYDTTIPFHTVEAKGAKHVYHLYTIRVHHRDKLLLKMKQQGIECGVHYPIPLHLQPAYASFKFPRFPIAEKLSFEILSIPIYPELTEEEQCYIVDTLEKTKEAILKEI